VLLGWFRSNNYFLAKFQIFVIRKKGVANGIHGFFWKKWAIVATL
jgi:hypothetical protein